VYAVMPGWMSDDRDYLALSDQAVEKALALDDTLALAHAVVGSNMITRAEGTPNLFMERYNKAIALDPKNPTLYMWRGLEFQNMGYIDAAIADYEKCLALDPLYDNSTVNLADAYVYKGDPARAVALYLPAASRGFNGMADSIVSALLQVEGEAAALFYAQLYLGNLKDKLAGAEWYAVIADPTRDPSPGLEIIRAAAEKVDYNIAEDVSVLLDFKAYDQLKVSGVVNHYPIWDPRHADFRRSPHFARIIRGYGYDKYWRKHGFPPQCRAIDETDFVCD